MPTLPRTHRPAEADTAPAVRASRVGRAWLVAIVLLALIVFIVSRAQTTVLVALIMALAAMVAGGVLLSLMFGSAWIMKPRRRTPKLRPRH